MVRRGRFLSNIVIFLIIQLAGCDSRKQISRNGAHPDFNMVNDVMYFRQEPYTGQMFNLYPGSKDTSEIVGYLNGREHGLWTRFYPDGKLREERQFASGFKIGRLTAWWENGKKKLEYVFQNNEYEGTCREWNAVGRLTREMNYKKGYEEGSQKVFYDNGKVRSNYVVLNGRRYGLLGTKNCVNASDRVFEN